MIANSRILWLPGDAEERHMPWDDVSPSSSRNPSGVRVDSDTALQSTVVLACARVLAESIAALPLHIYEYLPQGGKAPAKQHPLYRRLHTSPNSWQTSFEWREQQVLWLALWGNSYNLLVPGESGFATELWPLHPSRMKVERIENGRLRYKYRDELGREETYTQDQIMHIRWLSDDGIHGMVPVELAKDAIGLARACEIHGARFFGNGARPGFVLTTDNDMKPEAAAELRNNWERMHRGPDRSNRTAVLFGGLKPVELASSSNHEAQFLETRRFQIEEICRLYRVPPHLVGDLTRSSFSNIEQQSIDFVQHTLLPWLRRFENAFARDLIVEDEKYFAEFDTRGLLRGDAAARASYYNTLSMLGVVSINEIRSWENMNPIEGGDRRFVQLNMQTLDQANAAASVSATPDGEQPEPQPAEEEPVADVSSILAIVEQIGSGAITPEAAKSVFASVFPQMPPAVASSIIAGAVKTSEPAAEPLPTEGTPLPSGRSLQRPDTEDAVGSEVEPRSLTISIDFDRTFSADPQLWGEFARKAVSEGNTVVMVSRREDTPENWDEVARAIGDYAPEFSKVLLVGSDSLKDEAAKQAGISVDIWVDDSPQFVKPQERGFCPTGTGGGIDNSCSSKDGGGGGGGGGGGKISKSSLKAGMKVTIQKKGAKTATTGVVKSVSHEGKKSVVTFENGKSITIYDKATIEAAGVAYATTGSTSAIQSQMSVKEPPAAPAKPASEKFPTKPPPLHELPQEPPASWTSVTSKVQRDAIQEAIVATPTAREAIKLYSGSHFSDLNESLRKSGEAGADLMRTAQAAGGKLNAAMTGALDVATQIEFKESRTVYRGLRGDGGLSAKFAKMEPGDSWVDTGFASTSRSLDTASGSFSGEGGIVMKITTRHGLPIEDISLHKSEREVLLPRNLRYQLKSKEWRRGSQGGSRLHVEVETVGIDVEWTK